jgi:hypothetical protein
MHSLKGAGVRITSRYDNVPEMFLRHAPAICLVFLASCATEPKPAANPSHPVDITSQDQQFAVRNQGYSLLHKLLSDEKNLSKLLIIKKEQTDTGALLREISEVTGNAAGQLERFEKSDPHLHLKLPSLPMVEQEARDLISKADARELITKGGEKFEVRVLVTQADSLRYGAALAAAISNHEADAARKKFLAETGDRLEALHQKLIALLHRRWEFPAPPK